MNLPVAPPGFIVTNPNYGCAHYVLDESTAVRLSSMIEDSTLIGTSDYPFEPVPGHLIEELKH